MQPTRDEVLRRFAADDLLRRVGAGYRTTRRWQAAMARAAVQLYERGLRGQGGERGDLRVPIALALVDIYGVDTPDDTLAGWVELMLPIEQSELLPRPHAAPAR